MLILRNREVTLTDMQENKTTDGNLQIWSPIIQIILSVSDLRALNKTPMRFYLHFSLSNRNSSQRHYSSSSLPQQQSWPMVSKVIHNTTFSIQSNPLPVIILFEALQYSCPSHLICPHRGWWVICEIIGLKKHTQTHTLDHVQISYPLHAIALNMNIKL